MADRVCQKCGKQFKYPSHLKAHLQRKTPCGPDPKPVNTAEIGAACQHCGKSLATDYSMRRHIKEYCKYAPTNKQTESLRDETIMSRLEEQDKKLQKMTKLMETMIDNVGTVTTKVYINGNVNNIHNTILYYHSFGEEDHKHITAEYVENLLRENARQGNAIEGAHKVMIEMAQSIYSNPDVPENLTSFAPNDKFSDALVLYDKSGWTRETKIKLCLPMINHILDQLFVLQPHNKASELTDIMKELQVYDKKHSHIFHQKLGVLLRRNRDLILERRGALPKPGEKEEMLCLVLH